MNRAFGTGLFSGGINVLLWVSYIVMLALYASAFGSYAASFLPEDSRGLGRHVFLTGVLLLVTALNVAGASTLARTERVVVAIKVTILLVFVAVGRLASRRRGSRRTSGAPLSPWSLAA